MKIKKIIIPLAIAVVLGIPNSAMAWWGADAVDLSRTVPNLFGSWSPPQQTGKPSDNALLLALIKQHLEVNRQQLEQAKKMQQSIMGNKASSTSQEKYTNSFFKDPQSVYDSKRKHEDISASFEKIRREEEEVSTSLAGARESIEKRSEYAALVDKAISLQAFQQTENRSKKILELLNKIDKTRDLKSIADLQAQIKGKLAMIQNEATKLQMVAYLRNTEQELISQQKQKRNLKILNSKSKEMPTIRFIR
ncbi:type IV secretion system protein [Bartonella quintana]|uniref:type IV secretion system protein n=1 Tax=Bartonella quintana TaxID=803 RepID=UPI001374993E|nr:type IV secretion system protein [Bartonella quintana]